MQYQNYASLGVNLNRQKYGPLDVSEVFTTEVDLKYYTHQLASSSNVTPYWLGIVPYPYPGLIVKLVTSTDVKVYVLKPRGSTTTIDASTVFDYEELSGSGTIDDGELP